MTSAPLLMERRAREIDLAVRPNQCYKFPQSFWRALP